MLPVFDFHEIWLTYSNHIWTVFMLKLYLDKDPNMIKCEFEI